ncbi:MAG TPA: YIP1 family protein [Mariprofundaceae bacterium]|nr:YIP1 family protein [Mariprofundaceae bacterium]
MSAYFEGEKPIESFAAAVRDVVVAPGLFFEQMPKTEAYGPSVYFLSLTLAVPLLIGAMMTLGFSLFLAPFLWLVMLALTWLWAWYLSWAVKLFGKQALSTPDAFQICAYANVPILLAWVPVLNVVLGLWSLALEWYGLTRYAHVSSGVALLILLVPMIILMLSMTVLVVLIAVFASQNASIQEWQVF